MTKKNQQKHKPVSVWQRAVRLPWYIKIATISLAVVGGFFIFKFAVNTYNISLLDKAEAKIGELDLPKADHTTHQRSCSFRSVKFGGAGSPNCRVTRSDVFLNKNTGSARRIIDQYLTVIPEKFPDTEVSKRAHGDFVEGFSRLGIYEKSIEAFPLQKGLKCHQSYSLEEGELLNRITGTSLRKDSSNLFINTSCYRRFMFQTYPEL